MIKAIPGAFELVLRRGSFEEEGLGELDSIMDAPQLAFLLRHGNNLLRIVILLTNSLTA